ncbi:NIPSNAP family protein [Rudaea sp.]|uniref:NIPSNAP family protein n=1 Tax=Rudaea sp. TaxID=2136325 RepID=UPI002ED5713B
MPHPTGKRLIEVRAYKLKAGTGAEFNRLITTIALPMLRAVDMDVVACGASAHEADTYYLIRAYADLADLNAQQDAFYGSDAWRLGPREAVLACIDHFLNTVLWLSPEGVEDLRRSNPMDI